MAAKASDSQSISSSPKSETSPGHPDEDRLAQALIHRGLVSRDEIDLHQPKPGAVKGPEVLLARLVEGRCLTAEQARRIAQEISLFVGQQIPGYQLLEKLGQGSMGVVYKARQLSMNRLVAIKVLLPHLAANPKDLDRFLHEAHLAAKLSHNNIVQAIDAGSVDRIHYFVMEYVEGITINDEIKKGKVYEEGEGLEIILQIAQAIEHAHRRQLIHRDIKPANIVLTTEGIAKLADLGLARQTTGDALAGDEKGMILGTPYYIAPEQVLGREDIDGRADIYSLGATLYHMVAGRPPFPSKDVDVVLDSHLTKELTPPDHINQKLSSGLGEVVEMMMAKKRSKRYPSPRELIIDLECLLNGQPPKIARQQIEASVLEELAEGEAAEEDEPFDEDHGSGIQPLWLWVLGGLLILSVLLNLVLLLRNTG